MNTEFLAEQIKIWFQKHSNNRNRWNDNEVGRILQAELKNLGNWKGSPRGNPRLGGKMKGYSKAVRDGYEGPPPFKPKSKYAKFYQE